MTHDEGYVLPPNHLAFISKSYDELIAYIDDSIDGLKHEHLFEKLLANTKALRAVVELLKDYSDGQVRVNEEFNQGILALSNVIKEAIEKELK